MSAFSFSFPFLVVSTVAFVISRCRQSYTNQVPETSHAVHMRVRACCGAGWDAWPSPPPPPPPPPPRPPPPLLVVRGLSPLAEAPGCLPGLMAAATTRPPCHSDRLRCTDTSSPQYDVPGTSSSDQSTVLGITRIDGGQSECPRRREGRREGRRKGRVHLTNINSNLNLRTIQSSTSRLALPADTAVNEVGNANEKTTVVCKSSVG
jgi:hypothetical protein